MSKLRERDIVLDLVGQIFNGRRVLRVGTRRSTSRPTGEPVALTECVACTGQDTVNADQLNRRRCGRCATRNRQAK